MPPYWSSLPVICLWNEWYQIDQGYRLNPFEINFESFGTFRYPLFLQQITGGELLFGSKVSLRDSSDYQHDELLGIQDDTNFIFTGCLPRQQSLKRMKNIALL